MSLFAYFFTSVLSGWATLSLSGKNPFGPQDALTENEKFVRYLMGIGFGILLVGAVCLLVMLLLFDALAVPDSWFWERQAMRFPGGMSSALILGLVTGTSLVLQILWMANRTDGVVSRGSIIFWSAFNLAILAAGFGQVNVRDVVASITHVELGGVRLDLNNTVRDSRVGEAQIQSPQINGNSRTVVLDRQDSYRYLNYIYRLQPLDGTWSKYNKKSAKDIDRYRLLNRQNVAHIWKERDINVLHNTLYLTRPLRVLERCMSGGGTDSYQAVVLLDEFVKQYLQFQRKFLNKPWQGKGPSFDAFLLETQTAHVGTALWSCVRDFSLSGMWSRKWKALAQKEYFSSPYYFVSVSSLFVARGDYAGALEYLGAAVKFALENEGSLLNGDKVQEYVFMQRLMGTAAFITQTYDTGLARVNEYLYAREQLQAFDKLIQAADMQPFRECYEREISALVSVQFTKGCNLYEYLDKPVYVLAPLRRMLTRLIWVELVNLNNMVSFSGLAGQQGVDYLWPGPYVTEAEVNRLEMLATIPDGNLSRMYVTAADVGKYKGYHDWSRKFVRASLVAYYLSEASKGLNDSDDALTLARGERNLVKAAKHLKEFDNLAAGDVSKRRLTWRDLYREGIPGKRTGPIQSLSTSDQIYYQVWNGRKLFENLKRRYQITDI